MGNSPINAPDDEQAERQSLVDEAEDFCVYEDEMDSYYNTTCVKPEHIDQWRECAKVGDLELSGRLLAVEEQLALLRRQAKARHLHLSRNEGRIPARFLRHHLGEAHDQVKLALRAVTPR